MSRTREIEFWVEPDDIERLTNEYNSSSVLKLYSRQDSVSPNGQMVKLIQTLPERKVTISEGEFDEAWARNTGTAFSELRERLKEKFFKDA